MPNKDMRGARVEDWKIPQDVNNTLKSIRSLQKKVRNFVVAKSIIDERMQGIQQGLMTESKILYDSLPDQKTFDLQGMNFAEEFDKEAAAGDTRLRW